MRARARQRHVYRQTDEPYVRRLASAFVNWSTAWSMRPAAQSTKPVV